MRNLENNTLFLKPSSPEVFKPLNKQKTLYMSSLGRIYCLSNMFFIEYHNEEPYVVHDTKRKSYSIKELQSKLFQNGLNMKQKIEYEYFNVDESSILMDSLSKYIEVSDLFMLYLIDNMIINNFEKAASDFFYEHKSPIKKDWKNCLLKPVYNRYSHIHRSYHEKIRDNIKNKKMPKEIVLYDVPCKLENSELIIFDYLKINLRDYVADSYDELSCIYLGVTLFKEIRFKIERRNVIITLTKN